MTYLRFGKCSERYRDLLQASSSIVSISETSQRVVSALEEVKEACDTSSEVQTLQKSSNTRKRPMSIGGGLLLSRAGKQHADGKGCCVGFNPGNDDRLNYLFVRY